MAKAKIGVIGSTPSCQTWWDGGLGNLGYYRQNKETRRDRGSVLLTAQKYNSCQLYIYIPEGYRAKVGETVGGVGPNELAYAFAICL